MINLIEKYKILNRKEILDNLANNKIIKVIHNDPWYDKLQKGYLLWTSSKYDVIFSGDVIYSYRSGTFVEILSRGTEGIIVNEYRTKHKFNNGDILVNRYNNFIKILKYHKGFYEFEYDSWFNVADQVFIETNFEKVQNNDQFD